MQATHDLMLHGTPTNDVRATLKANFDHMTFSGAVPRTFIGSLILAGFATPVSWFANFNGYQQQVLGKCKYQECIEGGSNTESEVVRAIVGMFNSVALLSYASGVRKAYGKGAVGWFVVLQSSQFHVFYYASRTLPNMFAFGISMLHSKALIHPRVVYFSVSLCPRVL